MFLIVFAVPVIAASVALVFTIMARSPGPSRDAVVERYPLVWLTWLIAAPFGALALFGILLFSSGSISDLDGTGESAGSGFDPAAVLILSGFLVLVVAVIVLAHRLGRGRGSRPWLMLAVASPGIVMMLIAVFVWALDAWFVGVLGAVVVAGAIANGRLAVLVHRARAAAMALLGDAPPADVAPVPTEPDAPTLPEA